ncbi:hypothetical protein HRbin19_00949 [bacterium HR19]|nr:hypothetical protein HRbin19_00949 [bacterium HR19]
MKEINEKGQDFIKKVEDIKFLKKGWRGIIFVDKFENQKVAIKIAKNETLIKNIKKEAEILKVVNREGIGPDLIAVGYDFIITRFIEGEGFGKVLEQKNLSSVKNLFFDILYQARKLDEIKISKNEMHRPYSNIIVSGQKAFLIDFESSQISENPKNITQFFSFILSFLKHKGAIFPKEEKEAILLAQEYKKTYSQKSFEKILKFISDVFTKLN